MANSSNQASWDYAYLPFELSTATADETSSPWSAGRLHAPASYDSAPLHQAHTHNDGYADIPGVSYRSRPSYTDDTVSSGTELSRAGNNGLEAVADVPQAYQWQQAAYQDWINNMQSPMQLALPPAPQAPAIGQEWSHPSYTFPALSQAPAHFMEYAASPAPPPASTAFHRSAHGPTHSDSETSPRGQLDAMLPPAMSHNSSYADTWLAQQRLGRPLAHAQAQPPAAVAQLPSVPPAVSRVDSVANAILQLTELAKKQQARTAPTHTAKPQVDTQALPMPESPFSSPWLSTPELSNSSTQPSPLVTSVATPSSGSAPNSACQPSCDTKAWLSSSSRPTTPLPPPVAGPSNLALTQSSEAYASAPSTDLKEESGAEQATAPRRKQNEGSMTGRRYACELCTDEVRLFARPSALKIHMVRAAGTAAGLQASLTPLRSPLQLTHTKEKRECAHVQSSCVDADSLRYFPAHMCPTCKRSFAIASNLKRHQKLHLAQLLDPTGVAGSKIKIRQNTEAAAAAAAAVKETQLQMMRGHVDEGLGVQAGLPSLPILDATAMGDSFDVRYDCLRG